MLMLMFPSFEVPQGAETTPLATHLDGATTPATPSMPLKLHVPLH
jgi:hypothetical protein